MAVLPAPPRTTLRIARYSLLLSLAVFATKGAAYYVTGSVALFADALETLVNVFAAGLSVLTVWWSHQPADANHNYGHGKAEYLSAWTEGCLMLAMVFINSTQVLRSWAHPGAPQQPTLGLTLGLLAGVANFGWGLHCVRSGKRHRSPALTAHGQHILTDTLASLAVLAGFVLVLVTGYLRLDAIVAAFVTIGFGVTGLRTLREALGGLMDELPDVTLLDRLATLIREHGQGAHQAHDLRVRHVGRTTFVDFHLIVPAPMPIVEAHTICDQIEDAIRAELGRSVISIHLEPPHKAKENEQQGVIPIGKIV